MSNGDSNAIYKLGKCFGDDPILSLLPFHKETAIKYLTGFFILEMDSTNVAEAWKFFKDNPTKLTKEIAKEIGVHIGSQYTEGLTYLHAYTESKNDQDLVAALKGFRCCFDLGKEFINSDAAKQLEEGEKEAVQNSISCAAYTLFHVQISVQNKSLEAKERWDLIAWTDNVSTKSAINNKESQENWLYGILMEQQKNTKEAQAYFQRAAKLGHIPSALEVTIGEYLERAQSGDSIACNIVAKTAAALSELYAQANPTYFPKPDLDRSKKYANMAKQFAITSSIEPIRDKNILI